MIINEHNYVDEAEKTVLRLSQKKNSRGFTVPMVTTSKLRNLLAMTSDIYNIVLPLQNDILSDEIIGRIEYLRIRFVYEAGREPKVKELVEAAHILDIIKEINGSRKNYILFNRYMESIVAFRKFYGGKDE